MDTRSLELFLHLSQTLHFGQTSQAMHISPSALTRTIKQMEERLNVPLFIRDNRSVSLTRAGKLFQEYAQQSLNDWQNFRYSLMEETQELKGDISIYCSVTASYSFLYKLLSDFRDAHPKIGIRLHTGDPEYSIEQILNGKEDIGISACPDTLPPTLTFKPIAKSQLVVILPKTAKSKTINWETTPLILAERGLIRKRINEYLKQKDVNPTIYAQVGGNEAIVSMVSLGFGAGIVPKIVLDNSPLGKNVVIAKNQPELKTIEVGLCTQKKRLQNPLIYALWHSVNDQKV